MIMSLCVTPEAEQDLTAAFAWYEDQRMDLGTEFIVRVDELFARIREMPRQFPEVEPGYRRGLLQRFPYGVYFSVERDRVVVHAVLHLHRDPKSWQQRLDEGSG